jgi:hypothetical protein
MRRRVIKPPKSHPVAVRLDPEMKEAAERAASDDSRSLSSLIRIALGAYLIKAGYIKKSPK